MLAIGTSWAQNQEHILRYSKSDINGSARTLGLAGAWGSVGADLGAVSINPAGLGLYRRNEALGSISIANTASNSTFIGNITDDGRTSFNIPNLGVALNWLDHYKGKETDKGLVSATFAAGFNRTQNFQQNVSFEGINSNGSISNYLAARANGIDSSNFLNSDFDNDLRALAWRTRLIDNTNSGSAYGSWFNATNDTAYSTIQSQQSQIRGRILEWYLATGANFGNTLYLGASLVFADVDYRDYTKFDEIVATTSRPTTNPYKSSTYSMNLKTTGSGIGGKFGFIVRPIDELRIGASYQTPIRINLRDDYDYSLTTRYTNGKSYSEPYDSRTDYYDYQIKTAAKINYSASVIISSIGLISVDYEMIDYSSGRIKADDITLNQSNNKAQEQFDNTGNLRVGGEIMLDYVKLRVGYALLGSPYKSTIDKNGDGKREVFSAGFGFVIDESYFFDFALSRTTGKDFYKPYETNAYSAENSYKYYNAVLSCGIKF